MSASVWCSNPITRSTESHRCYVRDTRGCIAQDCKNDMRISVKQLPNTTRSRFSLIKQYEFHLFYFLKEENDWCHLCAMSNDKPSYTRWRFERAHQSLLARKPLSAKRVFSYLSDIGIIPARFHKHQIRNDRFGFFDQRRRRWVEWEIPSLALIRQFWKELLDNQVSEIHDRVCIEKLCQEWVSLLPESKLTCKTCQWSIPFSSMNTLDECELCAKKKPYKQ